MDSRSTRLSLECRVPACQGKDGGKQGETTMSSVKTTVVKAKSHVITPSACDHVASLFLMEQKLKLPR